MGSTAYYCSKKHCNGFRGFRITIFFNQVSNKNSPRTNQKGKTKKKQYQLKLANEDGNTNVEINLAKNYF
jgi:hypothetical protein